MKRYAKALVERTGIHFDEWMEEIRNQHEGAVPKDYVGRVAKTVLRKCDPQQYLLSHATIVASVDTYAPKNVKLGRQMNRGTQIDVRWPDFRVTPECHELINNNGDCWSRPLLLNTYKTFIGASNYLEHVQIPELSKGFIVDAIARDLGKSVYIDILVATERKHKQLISDILSGSVSQFSMGCVSLFTTCTKCGNVAADDSQLCSCIQYEGKGSTFVDEDGVQHPISELIGHVSVPNSNQFIEASWVRNPAFRGAVRRNFLNPESPVLAAAIDKSKMVHEVRSLEPLPEGLWNKAASRIAQGQQDQVTQDAPIDETDEVQLDDHSDIVETSSSDKLDELIDKAQEQIMSLLVKGIGEKLQPKNEDVGTVAPPVNLESGNESMVRASSDFSSLLKQKFPNSPKLVRWATQTHQIVHEGGPQAILSASLSPRDLIVLSWIEDCCKGNLHSETLYRTAIKVGSVSNYPSKRSFLTACQMQMGRNLSEDEQQFFLHKGRIASVGF